MTTATAPIGVITQEDGTLRRLVYDLAELAVHSLDAAPRYPAYCGDADCADPGCFGAWTEAGDTYHCSNCIQAYDRDYQCAVWPKTCLNCCAHATCAAHYQQRLKRPYP